MDNAPIARAEHEEFVKRVEEEYNRQNHRIEVLEGAIKQYNAIVTNVERLAVSMENMAKEQERQGKRLEALESHDGQMWRTVVGYVITTIIGILLGFVATHLGF